MEMLRGAGRNRKPPLKVSGDGENEFFWGVSGNAGAGFVREISKSGLGVFFCFGTNCGGKAEEQNPRRDNGNTRHKHLFCGITEKKDQPFFRGSVDRSAKLHKIDKRFPYIMYVTRCENEKRRKRI